MRGVWRRLHESQRVARYRIETELRREHWGHLPEGWRARAR